MLNSREQKALLHWLTLPCLCWNKAKWPSSENFLQFWRESSIMWFEKDWLFFFINIFSLSNWRRWIMVWWCACSGSETDLTAGLNYRQCHNCLCISGCARACLRVCGSELPALWLELSIIDDVLMRSIKPDFAHILAAEADNAVMTY